ncbi:hypothetical protein Dsin_008606 [Dipteronia sinensis]|uniref:Uncharacterized protein n=1 Tax=Dipteronia sinensis TaxID=43782 RepID=A0AAE0AP07_9ROSI|nr:hypothetical protein Dsin_008606 [Dipteronia sinensis]
MVLIVQRPVASKALSIILVILAAVFYTYLAVIVALAIVISVLEEKSGIEALGNAAQIGMRLVTIDKSSTLSGTIGLILVISICLVRIFWLMAYTVFYYQCKSIHGEEIGLQGSIQYRKKPSTLPLVDENIL